MENTEAKRNIKLIAFDLDGTTLHGFAELSERNRRAMEKANDAGILVVPATGRVRNFIPPCLTELPFIRYAITSNGGAVWDILENKVLCTDLIPTETALEVQKILTITSFMWNTTCTGAALQSAANRIKPAPFFGFPEEKYYFLTKDYTFADNLSAYLKETHAEPEKINMMFIPESVRPKFWARLQKLGGIELTFSNVDNIEINKKGCDRAPHCIRSARSSASIQKHHGGGR